ncbi:MAG: hypothetical protein DIZ78_09345 [endosymbiont of Escarpia spicata]|uniref:Uncharacterized protein n=1 Tax=endosymbiont of Escarpia spicata TaxID=2200908 RepID=A0A370DPQ2_9GAMM|nr:MAG: hypothetical protein DIZ78_09345 [endosymbiont of Escarpia spicata]
MAYSAIADSVGRQPITVVEIDLDYCAESYGVSPCTASAATGGECYNTRRSCQDLANWNGSTQTYRFIDQSSAVPPGVDALPCITGKITRTPMKIEPGKGLGLRGSVKVKLRDFTIHDRAADPYHATRTAEAQGTYFGRLIARNPFYVGRTLRLRTGYIASPWDWANFVTRTYVIEDISGPGSDGMVTITGKTVLKALDDDRVRIPSPSNGELSASLNTTATTFTLTPSGIGSEYDSSGAVRIGGEIITYTTLTGDVISGATRAQWGSEVKDHDAADQVQQCKVYSSVNVVNIAYGILVTDGPLSASQVPFNDNPGSPDEWDDEKANWLSTYNLTAIISEPTGANKLLAELSEQCGFNLWEDEVNNLVKLKANVPDLANAAVTDLNEDAHIIEKSIKLQDNQKSRISRVLFYYDKIDHTSGDDIENFRALYVAIDANSETDDEYGSERARIIKSRWMDSTNSAEAVATSGRLINRFAVPQKIARFRVDAKDALEPGQLVNLLCKFLQDTSGASVSKQFQVTQISERDTGHSFEIDALGSAYAGLYRFVGPDTLNDYDVESDANKQSYAFIALDTGLMSDGASAYQIV